jgi:hypothetical protein
MPVLLLARGDSDSKTMLRRAIEARYGLGPPAIETLRLDLKGRTRAKVGPVSTWMPLEGIAYFKFPMSVRWDFTMRPVGVPLNSGAAAFDGATCRKRHNRDPITVIDDAEQMASAQARMWTVCAVLLTPLAEHFVELKATGERTLDAIHTEAGITTHLQLHEDHTLDFAATECLNPDSGKRQTYMLRISDGQAVVGDLMLPRKVGTFWDEQQESELSPVAVGNNPTVDEALFRLEHD